MKITGTRGTITFDLENGYVAKAQGELLMNHQFDVYTTSLEYGEPPHERERITKEQIREIILEAEKETENSYMTLLFDQRERFVDGVQMEYHLQAESDGECPSQMMTGERYPSKTKSEDLSAERLKSEDSCPSRTKTEELGLSQRKCEDPYWKGLENDLRKIGGFTYKELPRLHQYPEHISRKVLMLLLERACQPTNDWPITLGREGILKIEPKWRLEHLLEAADYCIDYSDDWEYRRLLEVLHMAAPQLMPAVIRIGKESENEEVREAAQDFEEWYRETANLHLEEVNEENWRIPFMLKEEQKHYVSNPYKLLARAWAYRNQRSHAYVIYADETPVGMALYYDLERAHAYDFSQLFIDGGYQGRGYGEKAARLILDQMKADGKYDKAYLCYIEGNEAARRLYEKLGFWETGEVDEDEVIMMKEW